jgi:hypothetical protein
MKPVMLIETNSTTINYFGLPIWIYPDWFTMDIASDGFVKENRSYHIHKLKAMPKSVKYVIIKIE